jgi:hypothetical protein
MEVTGLQIKEALKMANLELETWRLQFDESLHAFSDEEKAKPVEVMANVAELEFRVAQLQTAQSKFNLDTIVKVGSREMPLEMAIKMVGGAGRSSAMWRRAAGAKRRRGYFSEPNLTRNKDEEQAMPTITNVEALNLAKKAERFASQLRGAIALGNTRKVDIAGLQPEWFA